jgi:hypothetical protein|tara:strand:+ start:26223 stop:26822 length:600 start_codon:yes stop_codon:yes gene_type:complete
MNTHAHAILNLFLLRKIFGEKKHAIPYFNVLAVFGSILPDLPMFLFYFFYTTVIPTSNKIIFEELYFVEGWQAFFNVFNSIPIFLLLVGIAWIIKNKTLFVVALASLLHFVGDFFVHNIDAHAHFFPFSKWEFHSPISYWNPEYHGNYFGLFEALLVLGLTIPLWRGLKNKWWRIFLVVINVFNIFNLFMWPLIFKVFG